jgi:hypothetical protein
LTSRVPLASQRPRKVPPLAQAPVSASWPRSTRLLSSPCRALLPPPASTFNPFRRTCFPSLRYRPPSAQANRPVLARSVERNINVGETKRPLSRTGYSATWRWTGGARSDGDRRLLPSSLLEAGHETVLPVQRTAAELVQPKLPTACCPSGGPCLQADSAVARGVNDVPAGRARSSNTAQSYNLQCVRPARLLSWALLESPPDCLHPTAEGFTADTPWHGNGDSGDAVDRFGSSMQ